MGAKNEAVNVDMGHLPTVEKLRLAQMEINHNKNTAEALKDVSMLVGHCANIREEHILTLQLLEERDRTIEALNNQVMDLKKERDSNSKIIGDFQKAQDQLDLKEQQVKQLDKIVGNLERKIEEQANHIAQLESQLAELEAGSPVLSRDHVLSGGENGEGSDVKLLDESNDFSDYFEDEPDVIWKSPLDRSSVIPVAEAVMDVDAGATEIVEPLELWGMRMPDGDLDWTYHNGIEVLLALRSRGEAEAMLESLGSGDKAEVVKLMDAKVVPGSQTAYRLMQGDQPYPLLVDVGSRISSSLVTDDLAFLDKQRAETVLDAFHSADAPDLRLEEVGLVADEHQPVWGIRKGSGEWQSTGPGMAFFLDKSKAQEYADHLTTTFKAVEGFYRVERV